MKKKVDDLYSGRNPAFFQSRGIAGLKQYNPAESRGFPHKIWEPLYPSLFALNLSTKMM